MKNVNWKDIIRTWTYYSIGMMIGYHIHKVKTLMLIEDMISKRKSIQIDTKYTHR